MRCLRKASSGARSGGKTRSGAPSGRDQDRTDAVRQGSPTLKRNLRNDGRSSPADPRLTGVGRPSSIEGDGAEPSSRWASLSDQPATARRAPAPGCAHLAGAGQPGGVSPRHSHGGFGQEIRCHDDPLRGRHRLLGRPGIRSFATSPRRHQRDGRWRRNRRLRRPPP